MKIRRFVWPEDRIDHIARHGVEPEDVEAACFGRSLVQRAKSEGATGADIKAICTEAGMFAIRDNRDIVTMADFEKAIMKVLDEGPQGAMESGPMFA